MFPGEERFEELERAHLPLYLICMSVSPKVIFPVLMSGLSTRLSTCPHPVDIADWILIGISSLFGAKQNS